MLILVSGALSAVLANDIVCLAMAPVLVEGCARRKLNPVPFLLALACSANVGSAATLIGNPQNMLIGQALNLSFTGYLVDASVPSILGLAVVWFVIRWIYRGRWRCDQPVPHVDAPVFNVWQSGKAVVVITLLMAVFLFTELPRDVAALAAAGILLTSRRMESREILGLVDWHLLVLFGGLFIVNHVLESSGVLAVLMESLRDIHVDAEQPVWLFAVSVVLSNLVSNVPATMLLLPSATHPAAGAILAVSSTHAGNLFIVGSIANIIVIDQAARLGVKISWREHARTGLPVTALTLAIAAIWLWARWA
jgi:Na+/H+ antiporter NhaD/arsenite permease-like protein